MAVKASAEVTLYDQTDASALIQWYYASTSATPPSKPTTTSASTTPSGWSKSEPTISSDSDLSNYVYACLQLVWGDGTCSWGDVSLSASFEAAKRAWNKAVASGKTASEYITDIDSNGITIHPSRSDYATNGGRAVINGDGLTIYLGSDDVASYGTSARIGKSNSSRVTVDATNGITIYKGNSKRLQTTANGIDVYGSDGTTSVASFGTTARLGSISSGNYMTLDSDGVEIHNSNGFSAGIEYDYVYMLGGEFQLNSELEASAGHGQDYWTRYCSFIRHKHYDKATMPAIKLYDQETISGETGAKAYTSGIQLGGPTECSHTITGRYQLAALDTTTGNNIALRANTAGNRGLYDITNDKWILYKSSSNELTFYDPIHLFSNTCTINSTNASVYGSANYCRHNYAVATITLCVNLKASLANGSTVDVATAPANYRPPVAVMGSVYVTGQNVNLQAQLFSGGTIRVNNRSGSAVTTSANIYMSFTFTPA